MADRLPVVDIERHDPAMVLQGRVRLRGRGVRAGGRHIEHLVGLRRGLSSQRNEQQCRALLLHLVQCNLLPARIRHRRLDWERLLFPRRRLAVLQAQGIDLELPVAVAVDDPVHGINRSRLAIDDRGAEDPEGFVDVVDVDRIPRVGHKRLAERDGARPQLCTGIGVERPHVVGH